MDLKANVLLVGSGGVGTIAALNLEVGGLAHVTAVLRSNFEAVIEKGFEIRSADHGILSEWRPTKSEENTLISPSLFPGLSLTVRSRQQDPKHL